MIYTVTFNPSVDYIMNVNSLSSKDVNRAQSTTFYAGGKGINVSAVLSELGVKNKALGFLAGFSGKQIENMIHAENTEPDFIYLTSGCSRINVKIRTDKEIDINADGPEIGQQDINRLYKKLENVKTGDYLVLAGSVPASLPDDIYETIMKKFSGKGIRFVVDAAGSLLKNVLKYKPFLVKPNQYELGEVFSADIKTAEDAVKYAVIMQNMGAKNVLVSMGADGAVLAAENGTVYTAKAVQGQAVNTVGCGDSMVAGFLAGIICKNDYKYALRLGTACAAATAFSEGIAEKNQIENICKKTQLLS